MSGRRSVGGKYATGLLRPPPVAPTMTFPILTAEEIVVSLGEMGITIVEDDLIKARSDVLKAVFDQLVMLVLNVTKDELYQAQFAGLAAIDENSELHEESVHVVHWLRAMNKLLAAAGMPEGYTLKDMLKPDRGKVQKALSGVINLQKFRESVQEEYDAHVRRSMELMEEWRQVEEETETLKAELASIRALREAERPEMASLESELAAPTAVRNELAVRGEALRASGSDTKAATVALIDDIRKLESQIAAVQVEAESKRGQLVSSPSRLREELDSVVRSVEASQAELSAAEDERRALTRRLEIVRKADKDVTKSCALLAELESEMARLKAVNKAVKARQAEREGAAGELAELEATTRHLDDAVRAKEARLAELRAEFDSRAGSADRATVQLRQELMALQGQAADLRAARADAEVKRKALEEAKERGVAQHVADMADITASVKALQEAVGKYHSTMFKKVAEVAAASSSAASKARAAGLAGLSGGHAMDS